MVNVNLPIPDNMSNTARLAIRSFEGTVTASSANYPGLERSIDNYKMDSMHLRLLASHAGSWRLLLSRLMFAGNGSAAEPFFWDFVKENPDTFGEPVVFLFHRNMSTLDVSGNLKSAGVASSYRSDLKSVKTGHFRSPQHVQLWFMETDSGKVHSGLVRSNSAYVQEAGLLTHEDESLVDIRKEPDYFVDAFTAEDGILDEGAEAWLKSRVDPYTVERLLFSQTVTR